MSKTNDFFKTVRAYITKSQPGSSNVHVPSPMDSEDFRIAKAALDYDMNPPIDNLESTMLNAAFGQPFSPNGSETGDTPQAAPKPGTDDAGKKPPAPPVKKDTLNAEGREHIKDDNFALPAERRYPIHDLAHARNALARVSGKPEEAKVKAAVYRKYPALKERTEKDAHDPGMLDKLKGLLDRFFDEEKLEKSADDVHPTKAPEGGRRVATVAVMHKNKILMGKRRDNNKWTMPGGHVDDGEDMLSGAKRELQEETGIGDAEHMEELMDLQKKTDKEGKPLHVQPFVVKFDQRPSTSMMADPDGEIQRWRWMNTEGGLPDEVMKDLHVPAEHNCLLQALGLVAPPVKPQGDSADFEEPPIENSLVGKDGEADPEGQEGDNDETGLYSLQAIVSGIDYECEVNKITDEEMARDQAMANLADDPEYYQKAWNEIENEPTRIGKDTEQTEDSPTSGMGFNLDLGSGQAREPNHIGLDLYPYDYGTLIQDLNQGIPFPDESAKSVRLVNALHHMDGLSDDPKPLLSEIERVLMPGGQFHYEGPDEIYNYPEWLEPNENESAEIAKEDGGFPEGNPTWVKQTFTRLAKPDAATANDAEPRIGISQEDQLPADALLAMNAVDYYNSDATTSGRGNRLHGYPSQGALVQKNGKVGVGKTKGLYLGGAVPIMKMNIAKQIVYGVVLSPNEADLQDDMMTAEDIETTAHNYLERSRVVGAGHDKAITAHPVESYIAPQDIEWEDGQYGPQKITKGAWVLGVKVVDPKEWKKVVNGDYSGFSVGGFGLRDPLT